MPRAKTPRTEQTNNKTTPPVPETATPMAAASVNVTPAAAPIAATTSAMPTDSKKVVPISNAPNLEQEIRQRAYELYLQRGSTPGQENDDWLVAEREVRARFQRQQSA